MYTYRQLIIYNIPNSINLKEHDRTSTDFNREKNCTDYAAFDVDCVPQMIRNQ